MGWDSELQGGRLLFSRKGDSNKLQPCLPKTVKEGAEGIKLEIGRTEHGPEKTKERGGKGSSRIF